MRLPNFHRIGRGSSYTGLRNAFSTSRRLATLRRMNKPPPATQLQGSPPGTSTDQNAPGGSEQQPGEPAKSKSKTKSEIRVSQASPDGSEGDPAWLTPGGEVNQYELIRELGRGGMGTVWLARDRTLGRRVAIKFLSLPDPMLRDRFVIEARATAQCQHPNIVVIHEVNEYDAQPFMVLEFLEGQPFSGVINDQIVTPPRAVELMIPVARALVRAAKERLVHRDLKPDNIFLTSEGTVKVLDFGIAKLFFEESDSAPQSVSITSLQEVYSTISSGGLVGTLPYMSPEQWGLAPVDQRTDIWAVGIILHEMVTGKHPVHPLSAHTLTASIGDGKPFPSVRTLDPGLPDSLVRIIDRCLEKNVDQRYESAEALLTDLAAAAPGASAITPSDDGSPYPGLTPFQESDAGRFFGRTSEIHRAVTVLDHHPMLAVVGPSGVGKSSFVKAGVVPALKGRGEEWESLSFRPGRKPFDALATLIGPLLNSTRHTKHEDFVEEHETLAKRLREEPGHLGTLLRARARQRGAQYLLYVDQFEELYALVSDEEIRRAFTRCIAAVADDASTPLRVVLSMRSDMLDRIGEDPQFQALATDGIMLLSPPSRDGLRQALLEPASLAGYRFESDEVVTEMLDVISESVGALPLLQFAAAKLWDKRDREKRVLSRSAYDDIGGIGGALARHADEVIASLGPDMRNLARTLFQRLVTPDRTKQVLELTDARGLLGNSNEVMPLVQRLSTARLLVLQTGDEGDDIEGTVELVHESLIQNWPTLRRWLEETHEETEFLVQLGAAAKQWEARGRDVDLLWRGETLDEAIRFKKRNLVNLTPREEDFLEATVNHSLRRARLKRGALGGVIVFLLGLLAVGAVALTRIQAAERDAVSKAKEAEAGQKRAETAEAQVDADRKNIREKLAALEQANHERDQALENASNFEALQAMTKAQLVERDAEFQALLQRERAEVKKLRDELLLAQATGGPSTKSLSAKITKLKTELSRREASLAAANKKASSLQTQVNNLTLQTKRADKLE